MPAGLLLSQPAPACCLPHSACIARRLKGASLISEAQAAAAQQQADAITCRLHDLLGDSRVLLLPTTPFPGVPELLPGTLCVLSNCKATGRAGRVAAGAPTLVTLSCSPAAVTAADPALALKELPCAVSKHLLPSHLAALPSSFATFSVACFPLSGAAPPVGTDLEGEQGAVQRLLALMSIASLAGLPQVGRRNRAVAAARCALGSTRIECNNAAL